MSSPSKAPAMKKKAPQNSPKSPIKERTSQRSPSKTSGLTDDQFIVEILRAITSNGQNGTTSTANSTVSGSPKGLPGKKPRAEKAKAAPAKVEPSDEFSGSDSVEHRPDAGSDDVVDLIKNEPTEDMSEFVKEELSGNLSDLVKDESYDHSEENYADA
ncbi:hypothetical protein N7478_010449 [Penicillium angulare]|uniref:uncharacterized protein n=1 Tax=Penicillium angulare TaxID=116970 RepID=UPI0025424343|nr:uncharacterized protein N7478_010449 [Penicillium angulare]KAJ5267641.1 hypothetical protein N7478_010449 [Penicillium angulare]